MSIYGSMNFTSITESTSVISGSKKNADWVRVYSENGKYYISGKELVEYMEAAEIFNFEEAVRNVEEANNVYDCVLNLDGFDESAIDAIREETTIVCEASPEDNATTLKKTMRWYKKFVKLSKSKAESKKELQDRIDVLKRCVKSMKEAKKTRRGQVQYIMKTLIPFNSIYRLIKYQDIYAPLASLWNYISFAIKIPLALGPFVRSATWQNMLNDCIKNTEEAIEYLEDRKKKDFA